MVREVICLLSLFPQRHLNLNPTLTPDPTSYLAFAKGNQGQVGSDLPLPYAVDIGHWPTPTLDRRRHRDTLGWRGKIARCAALCGS